MDEKRKHPRVPVDFAIAFVNRSGQRVDATCRDVSLGGAFILTTEPVPFASVIKVLLTLPGLEKEVEVPSTVRWKTPEGMGVQFGLMGARETHALLEVTKTDNK